MTPTVFLCEPSGLTATQRATSDDWHERLFGLGFDVNQLRPADYQPDPWPRLLTRMRAAHGVVVLGFQQLHVSAGPWQPDTELERVIAGTWSSPWLQVEAGLAIAEGIPLLVVPELAVHEGVFASGTWTNALWGTYMANPDDGIIDRWSRSVDERFSSTV